MVETTGMAIALAHTGEVISLEDFARGEWVISYDNPVACAVTLDQIRRVEALFRELKKDLTRAILMESEHRGSKTLHFENGMKAKISSDKVIHWDLEVLERLRAAGLPEDRYDALVKATTTYNVSAAEATRIANANPAYAEIINLARTDYESAHRVSVVRS